MTKAKVFLKPPKTDSINSYINVPVTVSTQEDEHPASILQRILNAAIRHGLNPNHPIYISPPRAESTHKAHYSNVFQYHKHASKKLQEQFALWHQNNTLLINGQEEPGRE